MPCVAYPLHDFKEIFVDYGEFQCLQCFNTVGLAAGRASGL